MHQGSALRPLLFVIVIEALSREVSFALPWELLRWPVRKENEVALQRAEMRMVRWMCGVKLQDRVSSKELRGD